MYFEWSSVVDAPVTSGMTLDEFKKYYRDEYGRHGFEGLAKRLEKVELESTTDPFCTIEELIQTNRCGPRGGAVSRETIIKRLKSKS